MQWFYAVNDQRLGPVSPAEFQQLVQSGVITPATLVWREGMADWQPYGQLSASPAADASADADTAVCAVSGQRRPKSEMVEYQGQWVSAEHRDAFFQRLREGAAMPGQGNFGSFGARAAAKILDGLLLFVAGVLVNCLLGTLLLGSPNYFVPAHGASAHSVLIFKLVSYLLGQAIALAYEISLIRRYNATLGKLALGLRLHRTDGAKLTVWRIVGRHYAEFISAMILCIGYLMAAFDSERRTLHDRICDTRVFKK